MKPILLLFLLLLVLLSTAHATPAVNPPPLTRLPTKRHWTPKHPFCTSILRNPKPLSSTCHQSRDTKKCTDGSYTLFSQMRQDFYLYTRHFTNLKRRGIYLDVATNDPISISNTYFMDACLGWSGLCVEAHPGMIPRIQEHRSCAVLPTCVGDKEGAKVEFVMDGGLSGVKGTNKNRNKWKKERKPLSSITQVCTTLGGELRRWDVTVVDYLSLDVEGHELNVLKGVDWRRVRVNVMSVETTKDSLPGIEKFMKSKGYKRHWPVIKGAEKSGLLNEDAVFLHKDVVWGKPQ